MKKTWNGEYPTCPTVPVDDNDLVLLSHLSYASITNHMKKYNIIERDDSKNILKEIKSNYAFLVKRPHHHQPLRNPNRPTKPRKTNPKSKPTGRLTIWIKTQWWLYHLNRYLWERERERERERESKNKKQKKNE